MVFKRKRWTLQQQQTLQTLYKKYKKDNIPNSQIAHKIEEAFPERTPAGVRSKLNRVHPDRTKADLLKKLNTMTANERKKLLDLLHKGGGLQQESTDLPEAPVGFVAMQISPPQPARRSPVKPRTPSPPPRQVIDSTRKTVIQELEATIASKSADKSMKKLAKRFLKLMKPRTPTPPPKPKAPPVDRLKKRAQAILGRPLRTPKARPVNIKGLEHIQEQLQRQFFETGSARAKRLEQEFKKNFKEAFFIQPIHLLAVVRGENLPYIVSRGDKDKMKPTIEKFKSLYNNLKNAGTTENDIEIELDKHMRSELAQYEKKRHQEEKLKMAEQTAKLGMKHLQQRMHTLTGLKPADYQAMLKTLEKNQQLKDKLNAERQRIQASGFSPATKKGLLEILEMPLAPKMKPRQTKLPPPTQRSPGDDDDDDGADGEPPVAVRATKKRRAVAV